MVNQLVLLMCNYCYVVPMLFLMAAALAVISSSRDTWLLLNIVMFLLVGLFLYCLALDGAVFLRIEEIRRMTGLADLTVEASLLRQPKLWSMALKFMISFCFIPLAFIFTREMHAAKRMAPDQVEAKS